MKQEIYRDRFELSDWDEEELRAVEAAGLIPFKDSPLWEPAVAEVRAVLATREHRPRGSREKRQQAARGRTPR